MLLPHHLGHLRASGLSDETIAAAHLRSVTDAVEAGRLLNWTGQGPVPAIALPNLALDGTENFTYLRPDFPRVKNGRELKYETPVGQAPRPYFASGTAALLADPKEPVVFTEGIKKALAVRQCGIAAISASGVTSWHDVAQRRLSGEWKLHPEIAALPLRGRRCEIVFDGGDTTHNRDVILAEARLARMLLDLGGAVRLIRVPSEGAAKVGIDDWLARQSDRPRDLRALLSVGIQADLLKRDLKGKDKSEIWELVNHDLPFLAAFQVAPEILRDLIASEMRGKVSRENLKRAAHDFVEQTKPTDDAPALSTELETAADAHLRRPDLLVRLLDAVSRAGLVGERQAATFVLLAAVSRKIERPINLIIKAPSSAGKNFLCRTVLSFLPEEDVHRVSGLTEQALRYLDEPNALKNKVLLLEEVEGGDRAEYDLRVLMSADRIELWVPERVGGNIKTVRRQVNGPLCVITTTTQVEIHDENETRTIEVALDSSVEQTKAIVREEILRRVEERPDVSAERVEWRAALSLLEPCKVRPPRGAAVRLEAAVNPCKLRARRDIGKLLSLVDAHTILYQRQRARAADGWIEAKDEDVDAVIRLASVFRSPLKPALAEQAARLRKVFGAMQFTGAGAQEVLGESKAHRNRILRALADEGVLEVVKEARSNQSAVYQFPKPAAPTSDAPQGAASAADPHPDGGAAHAAHAGACGAGAAGNPDSEGESEEGSSAGGQAEEDAEPDLWDLPTRGKE